MRRSPLLLAAVLLAAIAAPLPDRPAAASCAAPSLEVAERTVLVRGTSTTVTGDAFADGCQDSESCTVTFGCSSCEPDDPEPTPDQDVTLLLVQGERTWVLGTADAEGAGSGRLGHIAWTVEVPDDAKAGPARLVAEAAQPVRVRLR